MPEMNNHSDYKLFIGGIPARSTRQDFIDYFSKLGNVKSVKLKMNSHTKRCLGYGYVHLEDQQSYYRILNHQEHNVLGRLIEVKKVLPKD